MTKRDWWLKETWSDPDISEAVCSHMDRLGILFDVMNGEALAPRLQRAPGQDALAELLRHGFLVEGGNASGYPYSVTAKGHLYAEAAEAGRQGQMAFAKWSMSVNSDWQDIRRALSAGGAYHEEYDENGSGTTDLASMAADRVASLKAQERVNRRLIARLAKAEHRLRAVLGRPATDKATMETLVEEACVRMAGSAT